MNTSTLERVARVCLVALACCMSGCQSRTPISTVRVEQIPGLHGLETRVYDGGSLKERHMPLVDGTASLYYNTDKTLNRTSDFYFANKKPRGEALWSNDGKVVIQGSLRLEDGTVLLEQSLMDDSFLRTVIIADKDVIVEARRLPSDKKVTWVWKKGQTDKQELWFEDVVEETSGANGTRVFSSSTTFYRSSSDALSRIIDCTVTRSSPGTTYGGKETALEVVFFDDAGLVAFKQLWCVNSTSSGDDDDPTPAPFSLEEVLVPNVHGSYDVLPEDFELTGVPAARPTDARRELRLPERDEAVRKLKAKLENTATRDTSEPALRWHVISLP